MPSCMYIDYFFVLQYIIEPNNIVYFVYDTGDKLRCCKEKCSAHFFDSREYALLLSDIIKKKYGLEFQVVEV